MTLEVETKLVAPPGFDVGILSPSPGTVFESRPVRSLDATYYDTDDLTLGRWGVTLRHRVGDGGPGWTLKLPRAQTGSQFSRDEVTVDAGPGEVPAELRELVRGLTGARPLQELVRLQTTRTPLEVRSLAGEPLVEIVDDRVRVDGRHTTAFREIEVETRADTRDAREAHRRTVDQLVHAGCTAEGAVPKLVRALGPSAFGTPPVAVPKVQRHARMSALIHHAIASCVVQLIGHDPGTRLGADPEELHHFRVAVRRLRSDLQTFSSFLDLDQTTHVREELRWLGRAVGPARDLDVLATRFRTRIETLSDDAESAEGLLHRFDDQLRTVHRDVQAALQSDRYEDLLRTMRTLATAPPLRPASMVSANRPAATTAVRLVRKRWRRLSHAVDGLETPTDDDLHHVRILAKRCRYVTEAFLPILGPDAARFARAMEAVQTVLGDLHDTVVAEQWLRAAARERPSSGIVAGQLIAIEHSDRERLRSAWPVVWNRAARKKLRMWLT